MTITAELTCALKVAKQYGLDPFVDSKTTYKCQCPVCNKPNMAFAQSKSGTGYYFYSNCKCYSNNGYHSGDGRNLDFWLRSLGAVGQAMPTHDTPAPKPDKPATYDRQALNKVMYASREAMASPSAPAAQYLTKRGIMPKTAKAWKMGSGYWRHHDNKSVVFPWFADAGELVAISHRLINPTSEQPKAPWQSGMAGHIDGLLCGLQTISGYYGVLVLVEGILNAPSVWQTLHGLGVDVLTPGTENFRMTPEAKATITKWQHVLIWTDKPDVATKWASHVPGAKWIHSQNDEDGVKLDANELLQRGELADHLVKILYEREMLDMTAYIGCTLPALVLSALQKYLPDGWSFKLDGDKITGLRATPVEQTDKQ